MHISSAPFCELTAGELFVKFEPLVPLSCRLWYDETGFHIAYCYDDGDFEEVRDIGIDIFRPAINCRVDHPADKFQYTFDEEYVNFVSVFKKYQSSLLVLTFGRPAVYSFTMQNPVLFWLCCHKFVVGAISKDEVAHLATMKRREVLSLVAGKSEARYLKLLAKLKLKNWDGAEFRLLVRMLQTPLFVEAFQHWRAVSIEAVKVLDRYPFLANSKILQRYSDSSAEVVISDIPVNFKDVYFDTVELGKHIGLKHSQSIVDACECVEAVRSLHDSWSAVLNRKVEYLSHDEILPEPPLSGNQWIIPLHSVNEILREASEMKHCLASYIDKLRVGKSFIYRVIRPQRATCEIVLRSGLYEISQISLYKNNPANEQTWESVASWLAGENKLHNPKPSDG